MRCYVKGQEVASSALARRALNYSQALPDVFVVPYQIVVPAQEFVDLVDSEFQRVAGEEQADAPFQQPGDAPVLDQWKMLGYPSAKLLLANHPALLADLICEIIELEALDQLLPGPDTGLPIFLVNSLDRVNVQNGCVVLEGEALLHPALREKSAKGKPNLIVALATQSP